MTTRSISSHGSSVSGEETQTIHDKTVNGGALGGEQHSCACALHGYPALHLLQSCLVGGWGGGSPGLYCWPDLSDFTQIQATCPSLSYSLPQNKLITWQFAHPVVLPAGQLFQCCTQWLPQCWALPCDTMTARQWNCVLAVMQPHGSYSVLKLPGNTMNRQTMVL